MANFKTCFFLLSFLFSSTFLYSQYKLKSPDEFFPFKYGEQFTPHHLLVDYYKYVAENSNQIFVQEYGRTNEQRPLIWAIISSTENLKNLEQIRTDNLKRARLIGRETLRFKTSGNNMVELWRSWK